MTSPMEPLSPLKRELCWASIVDVCDILEVLKELLKSEDGRDHPAAVFALVEVAYKHICAADEIISPISPSEPDNEPEDSA